MSYNKLGFTSGQTLKAEHLNHMENGIEAIANNVQIKKAVFTDRQSVYEFLLENHAKTIYIAAKMAGYQYPSKFIPQLRTIQDANGVYSTIDAFTLIEINMFIHASGESSPLILPSCVELSENTTHYLFDPRFSFDANGVTVVDTSSVQELPDAYWSAANVEMTAYYFSE